MPIYEYYCEDCHKKFDAMRPMSKADAPIECEHCHSRRTSRQLSTFATPGQRGESGGSRSACASCSSHTCTSCGVK